MGTMLYVCAGPCSGRFLEQFKTKIPTGHVLLYIHPGDAELSSNDILTLTIPLDEQTFSRIALTITCMKFSSAMYSSLNNWPDAETSAGIHTFIRELTDGIHLEKISRLLHLHCAILNLPRLASAQYTKLTVPPGTAALICGAGPSLQSQMEQIRQAQNRLFIIAVGKLAPVLLRNGITPHCIVYVDHCDNGIDWPQVFNAAHPLLVTLTTSSPHVAAAAENVIFAAGPSVFFNRALPEWHLQAKTIHYAATATVTALDFALQAGFSAIAITGNDLCLGKEAAAHLPGYGGDEILESTHETIAGNNGPVITTPAFNALRLALEKFLEERPVPAQTVFNCTDGGAVITGTERRNLADFIAATPANMPPVIVERSATTPPQTWNWHPALDLAAREHAAHLALDQPRRPGAQITSEQRELTERLCKQFSADLQADLIAANRSEMPREDCFSGFRSLAIKAFRSSNPELADWLQTHPSSDSKTFELVCNFAESACITMHPPNGASQLLTGGYLTMEKDARNEITEFLNANHFNPVNDALIVVAPATWLHPIHAAKRFPELEMLVIEPWPELLSMLIDRCLFVHRLPPATAIAGVHSELTDWRRLCNKSIRDWKRTQRRPLLFINPRAANLPEVQKIAEEIQRLL